MTPLRQTGLADHVFQFAEGVVNAAPRGRSEFRSGLARLARRRPVISVARIHFAQGWKPPRGE